MSYPFHGQTAAFIARVIQTLPRDLSATAMQYWIEHPAELTSALSAALQKNEPPVAETVILEPFDASKLVSSDMYLYRCREELRSYSRPVTVYLVMLSLNELGYTHGLATMSLLQQLLKTRGLSVATPEIAIALADQTSPDSPWGTAFLPYVHEYGCGMFVKYSHESFFPNSILLARDPHQPMECSYNTPLILVRQIFSLEDTPAVDLFTPELCEQLGFTVPQRARVVNVIEGGDLHSYEFDRMKTLPPLLVRDLVQFTKPALMRTPNFGKVCVKLVEAVLAHHGLALATQ